MSTRGGAEDVLRQIKQLWSMLDDLSENDPAAYRSFTDKQLRKGAELRAPPELHSRLSAHILAPKAGVLYINICSWMRVPAPQDTSCTVPVYGGKLETGTSESKSWYAVLDVAFNPAVLQDIQEDKTDINRIYMMTLSFAQEQHGMQLSPKYRVVTCSPKSSPDDLHQRLGFQMHDTFKKTETAAQTPAALIQQISQQSDKQNEDLAARISFRPAERVKRDLIEVISTTLVQPQKPEYLLEVKTDAAGVPRSVELSVELPKVRSVSECQLSVSKDDVLLEVEGVYHLLVELPKNVKENSATAIFNKKKRTLSMTLDVL